jgi:hypothetical protein
MCKFRALAFVAVSKREKHRQRDGRAQRTESTTATVAFILDELAGEAALRGAGRYWYLRLLESAAVSEVDNKL